MRQQDKLAIWLTEQGARQFLGLEPSSQKQSRWVVLGRFKEHESHVGIWVSIDRIEERQTGNKVISWKVTPPVCLLRWEFIVTVQLTKKGIEDIGFQIVPNEL